MLESLKRIPGLSRLRQHQAVHHLGMAVRAALAGAGDNLIRPWQTAEFLDAVRPGLGRTLLGSDALFQLQQLARAATAVPGDFVEFGTYRGGTAWVLARLLAELAADKRLYLLDTFTGMPATDAAKDQHHQGDFADTSLAAVQELLREFPQVSLHPGLFVERFAAIADRRFAFAHIDCDIYQSVKQCCEFVYPRMSPGGLLVFDDYGLRSCPGATQAVDEFFAGCAERPIRLTSSQAIVSVLPRPQK